MSVVQQKLPSSTGECLEDIGTQSPVKQTYIERDIACPTQPNCDKAHDKLNQGAMISCLS